MTQPAKHTPGPWFVDGVYIIRGPKRCVVAKLIDSKEPYETKVANGHMLAAAPAMYEALKALHSVLDQRMPDGRTLNQHLSQEVFECFYGPAIAARAAIAKAEGA